MPINLNKNYIWSTAVFASDLESEAKNAIYNQKFLAHCNKIRTEKHNLHTIADPFLFTNDETLYLFVEEKRSFGKGTIAFYETKDLENWDYGGEILKEDVHLSYPYVFEANGTIYMMPETSEANGVFLYEAKEFPTKWEKKYQLLEGNYCDSNIIFHKDHYWLFTSIGFDELHVFYSKEILGEWQRIDSNPIVKDIRFGRNGGGVFEYNNQLYRCCQDCTDDYGGSLNIMKVTELSTTSYKEELYLENFYPEKSWWNKHGSHHLSFTNFKGKRISAVDGRKYESWLNKPLGLLFRI